MEKGSIRLRSTAGFAVFVALVLLSSMALPPITSAEIPQQARTAGSDPIAQPAIPAILAAFDRYEIVGIGEAHGLKDLDDLILSLIRTPAFSQKVNAIAVECGNSLYQPILDRYIAGEDVPFTEVRKVWRNTTQPMCSTSGFFEQLFPLVRAINLRLPSASRLRVLAGDPPIDWDQVKTYEDFLKFADRNGSIASVMKTQVLSKHRKALMLFGIAHLMHGVSSSAVTIYEKEYPNVTFVISYLGEDTNLPDSTFDSFGSWPIPSLALAKGTWLGALDLGHVFPSPIRFDDDCNVHSDFPQERPMAEFVNAFLYLGSQDLKLQEPMPADIALDRDYMAEVLRRSKLSRYPFLTKPTLEGFYQDIVAGAEKPLFARVPNLQPLIQQARQSCLNGKKK